MRKLILLSSLFLLASCYNQERNCSNFKTGKFKFAYDMAGVTKTTYFQRFDSIEIENFEGKIDTSSVRWLNDWECVLQKLNPNNRQEKKAVHRKLLTTTENSYTSESSLVGEATKQKGVVTKVE